MEFVHESAKKLPVAGSFDVVVLGGGPSGIAAAVAAAKNGSSVLLVEKNGYLGGAATAGLVCIWHSLYTADKEEKIIGGVIDEILERLQSAGAVYYLGDSPKTEIVLSTEAAKFVFDDLCLESGVKLLFHSYAAGVVMEGEGLISHVLVENKSGRSAIAGKVFVDATGDGDVAWHAGAEYEKGDGEGRMQPPGLCVRLGKLRLEGGEPSLSGVLGKRMDYNGREYAAFLWGVREVHGREDSMMLAAARILNTDCTDAWELSEAEIDGRKQIDWLVRTLRKEVKGFDSCFIADVAAEVYARETRRFVGDYMITGEDILTGREFDDVIAKGTYPVDLHNPSKRGIIFKHLNGETHTYDEYGNVKKEMWTPDGRPRDTRNYQIPYSVLLPRKLDNLLVAGRCVSCTHEALGAIRVMINCIQTGQAAGAGASIAASENSAPREVAAAGVQLALKKLGMPLR